MRGAGHFKKSDGLLREPKPMRFHFIAKEKANFSICRMCKVLRVSESGYYAWVSRPASQRQRDDRIYLAHIRAEHARNYRAYGRKRMTDELRDQGIVIGERRVGRLMRENDIRIVRTHKFKRTTNSNHNHNIVDPSRKSGGALHRLHCFCLEFDGACGVQRRVPTDWIIEPVDVSGYGSFSLAS